MVYTTTQHYVNTKCAHTLPKKLQRQYTESYAASYTTSTWFHHRLPDHSIRSHGWQNSAMIKQTWNAKSLGVGCTKNEEVSKRQSKTEWNHQTCCTSEYTGTLHHLMWIYNDAKVWQPTALKQQTKDCSVIADRILTRSLRLFTFIIISCPQTFWRWQHQRCTFNCQVCFTEATRKQFHVSHSSNNYADSF